MLTYLSHLITSTPMPVLAAAVLLPGLLWFVRQASRGLGKL